MGKTLMQETSLIKVFAGARLQTCLLSCFFDYVEKTRQQRVFLGDFVPQSPILSATFAHTEKNHIIQQGTPVDFSPSLQKCYPPKHRSRL